MEKNKSLIIGLVAVVLVIGGGLTVFALNRDDSTESTTATTQQDSETSNTEAADKAPQSDIVELAVATPDLSTLVSAVTAADLVTTLQGEGPFTVFAPTNAAFNALPAGTLDSLLLPENKATLSGILTYHVVAGKVMSSELKDGQIISTVNGSALTVEIMNGTVKLVDAKGNKATVTSADIEATNGVVHVIDSVLLP
jgi:uncharacterized surface protein with fasciclin (FAS1) repeats